MLVAGAILTLAPFSARANSETEERYRAKYGRYTEAYEAREKAAHKVDAPACCRNMNALFKNEPRESFTEALFRSKYGRSTPRVEAREKLVAEANAKNVRRCVELGKCTLMKADTSTPKAARAHSWSDDFYRSKYGRPLAARREEIDLAAGNVTCEHDCCKRSD
jgi:hypothetical protein